MPAETATANLHRDLERIVELADTEGWSIDRVELEETLPAALMSVCRTEAATRAGLASWLDVEIERRGGDVQTAYEAKGRNLSAVDDLLILTRIRMLLSRSMEAAEVDCPFWIHPRGEFAGRQILDDRFLLSLGGGGKGIMVRQRGETDMNFGGAGRLLVGRAFGRHATVLTGMELGGSAAFPRDEEGERGSLAIAVDVAVPLVYRHRLVNSYWEIESGYVAHVVEGEEDPSHGVRLGLAVGGTTRRRRWIFPGVAFGVSYERIQEDKVLHMVKLGFRVALDMVR